MTETSAQVSARILLCPARYVRETYGAEALAAIHSEAGVPESSISDGAWISTAQLAAFLEALRRTVSNDEEFRVACVHGIRDAYGPMRFLFHAASPATMLNLAMRTMSVVSRVGRCEVLEAERNRIVGRYHSEAREAETRLVCLSRQAQSGVIPTMFGLPPADVKESACIAHGDAYCEYEYRFFVRSHWFPSVLGLALGLGGAMLFSATLLFVHLAWVLFPLVGAMAGTLWEFRRTYRANVDHADQIRAALNEVAEREAEARAELLELHAREKQWVNHLEEEVAERTGTMQQMVDRLKALGERRIVNMRGFSHDLRNPLAVVMASIGYLRSEVADRADCCDALDDCETSVRGMEKLLSELVGTVQHERSLVRIVPEHMPLEPLVDRLRRRARALVLGRDIRVSVFKTREAPAAIHIDPLIFERVVDNLFTNAAKYTEKGSIVIELDGSPGFLTIKVSDTGCGIEEDDIQRIFRPGGSAPERRSKQSLGIGLSVVIRLLKQIGGRLEVMSKPQQGSTFWAHFPVTSQASTHPARTVPPQADDEVVASVVTIRRAS